MELYADINEHVKPFLGRKESDTTQDKLLNILNKSATSELNNLLNVDSLAKATYTDELFEGNTNKIYTKNFPVLSVTAIKVGSNQAVYTQTESYLVNKNVIETSGYLAGGTGYEQNRVTYVAGYVTYPQYAADGSGLSEDDITFPDDLLHALLLLIAGAYNKRNNVGVSSYTIQGRSVTFRNEDEAKEFETIINHYKKPVTIAV